MKKLSLATFSMALIGSVCVYAQEEQPTQQETETTGNDSPSANTADIEEIIVTPLLTRSDLRELEIKIEENFYARFNELNPDDEYDIICYRLKPTGSHISRRVCEPNFIYSARSENASEVMFYLGNPSAIPPPLLSEQELVTNAKKDYEELLRKMEEFMNTDAEFSSIGATWADIKYQIENYSKDQ